MQLLLCARDIRSITLGLVKDAEIVQERVVSALPDAYLGALGRALGDWSMTIENIDAVYVVTGPGSFTASRVSTTIANALAFVTSTPVIPLQNTHGLPLTALISGSLAPAHEYAVPWYDRPARITQPGKRSYGCTDGDNQK